MERVTRFRARILLGILVAVLVFFCFKLYDMQVIKTGGKKENITTFTTMTRVKAARGDILDTHGNVLVSNRASYNLTMNHYVLLTADGTTLGADNSSGTLRFRLKTEAKVNVHARISRRFSSVIGYSFP